MARFLKKRHGKTGSMTLLWLVTYRSQNSNMTHRMPETESSVMTYADFQGKRESASSNAAVIDKVASRSNAAPGKSTLALASFEKVFFHVSEVWSAWPWYGKFFGIAKRAIMRAGVAAGTLED